MRAALTRRAVHLRQQCLAPLPYAPGHTTCIANPNSFALLVFPFALAVGVTLCAFLLISLSFLSLTFGILSFALLTIALSFFAFAFAFHTVNIHRHRALLVTAAATCHYRNTPLLLGSVPLQDMFPQLGILHCISNGQISNKYDFSCPRTHRRRMAVLNSF